MYLQKKDTKAAETTALSISELGKKLPKAAVLNYIWCITTPALVYYAEGKNKEAELSLDANLKLFAGNDDVRKSLPPAAAMIASTFGDFAYGSDQLKKWEAAQKKKPDLPGIEKVIYLNQAEVAAAQGHKAEAQKLLKMGSEESGKKQEKKPKRILRNMFTQEADTLYSIALLDPLPAMFKRAKIADDNLYGKNTIEALPTLMGNEAYLRSVGDKKAADDCKVQIEKLRKSNKQPVITTQSSKSLD
jgi:hypothetical protein